MTERAMTSERLAYIVDQARKSADVMAVTRSAEMPLELLQAVDALAVANEEAVFLLRHVVAAERLERLPGDHAVSVALLSIDEFLANIAGSS